MATGTAEQSYKIQLADFLAVLEGKQRAETLYNLTLEEAAARAIYTLNGENTDGQVVIGDDPVLAHIKLEGPVKPKRQTLDDLAETTLSAIQYAIDNADTITATVVI